MTSDSEEDGVEGRKGERKSVYSLDVTSDCREGRAKTREREIESDLENVKIVVES